MSNNSTPTASGAAGGAGTPIAPVASSAAPGAYAAAIASAQASGIASNAFGIRDNQGVILLSLPPEGTFKS